MSPPKIHRRLLTLLLSSIISLARSQELNETHLPLSHSIYGQLEAKAPLDAALQVQFNAFAGYLASWSPRDVRKLNLSDPIERRMAKALDQDGPDLRPSRAFKDNPLVDERVAVRAWSLMEMRAKLAASDRIKFARPMIGSILESAQVNEKCSRDFMAVLDGAARLDSWAIKLINSWGNFPPVGLFEGTYSDIGSYETCTNIGENKLFGHAHYCSLTFRPLLSRRKDYELVLTKEPSALRNFFSRSLGSRHAFEDLIEHAQYNHFVYYKLGSCWPISCSPVDVKRVVKLLSRSSLLSNGPVKCYSHYKGDYEDVYYEREVGIESANSSSATRREKLVVSIWDKNDGIFIWKPSFDKTQQVALFVIVAVSVFIVLMTAIDICLNRIPMLVRQLKCALIEVKTDEFRNIHELVDGTELTVKETNTNCVNNRAATCRVRRDERSTLMSILDDCSIITNTGQFFRVSESQLKNDILCLHGIRCITMAWILMTHTMLYNDWSAWGRTRRIEEAIKSPATQPFFNGSYLVDTFFLMSGLLSALTAFKHCQGVARKFNSFALIAGRWLRLTPQILLASLLYIVLPGASSGPHWWPIVGEYSENCIENWWINVLHLQAFYKTDKMCNFVTWWISIDYFYHFIAVANIWILLYAGHTIGLYSILALVGSQLTWQAIRHYQLGLPPNIFSTIPQTGAMWQTMTLDFYWTPYTHAVPFFFGFYLGYLLALKREQVKAWLSPRRALIGWSLTASMMLVQGYGSYWWVVGEAEYSRWLATLFNVACPLIWTMSHCWTILACHHGYGSFVNEFLSARVFIILGKASYFVYLSHFLVLFVFFGNQHLLLEPTSHSMLYIIMGNTIMSTLLGIFLCIVYELPWLKQQRKLMRFI